MLILLALALQEPPLRYAESFENRERLDVVYDHWERVHSPDHPAYNDIAVDRDPAGSIDGLHLLRLSTRGGATAFQMSPRAAWRIDAGRPYRLSVSVRATGAVRNTATASLHWLDRKFNLLREDLSPPLIPGKSWTALTLDAPLSPADALWVRVRLEYAGGDVRGECRFDALALEPVVRLELAASGRRLPVFEPGAPIRFETAAYGLEPGAYTVTLRTEPHASAPAELRPGKPLRVELPPHDPGFYVLTAEVAGPKGVALRREAALVVPNPWRSRPPEARWIGASVNPFSRDLPDAAALAQLAGFDRLRLTFADHAPPGRRAPDLSRLTDTARALAAGGHARLTGVLAKPTPALFPQLEDVDSFSRLGRGAWEKALRAVAGRHADGIGHWELGEGSTALRWSAEDLLRPESFLEGVPATTAVLPPPAGPDAASTAAFLRGLLERAAAEDRPDVLYVPLDHPLVDADGWPRAPLAALRAMNDLLSGARPKRDAPPLLGVRELAFEKDGELLLAFWSEAETEREAHLGDGAIVYPPLGAARPHRPGERLRIGPLPLLVANVDALALETRAGLRLHDPERPDLTDARLPLRIDPATRRLSYRNLSKDEPLADLRIRLVEPLPPGWQIRPAELRAATLAPEQEISQDLLFVLPPGADERPHELQIELAFRRKGVEQTLRLTRTLEVRSAIGIEVSSTPDGATALRVALRFTNRETRPLTFLARVRLPGLPEQELPLGPLEPGAGRDVEWRVRDAHLVDPTRLFADVIAEERGGDRAYARRRVPLRGGSR